MIMERETKDSTASVLEARHVFFKMLFPLICLPWHYSGALERQNAAFSFLNKQIMSG